MLIKTLTVGFLDTNCYIVTDETTRVCAIIDPGAESNTVLDYIEANRLTPQTVFLTHGHFDHHMALTPVLAATGATAYIHRSDVAPTEGRSEHLLPPFDGLRTYAEGDKIPVGDMEFTVIETPGHTEGSVALICRDALFTGDTLFRDSCGRTDSGGSMEQMLSSLRRLAALPGDYEVYPGHAESTTLDEERRFNYYMRYALDNFPQP